MIHQSSNNPFRLRRVITVMLMAWLGGLNCLLCCGPNVLAATPEVASCSATAQTNAESRACAEDDCCAVPEQENESSAPCEEECCILDAPAADLPPAPQQRQLTATLAAMDRLPTASLIKRRSNPSHLRPPLLGDQQTYLRCCVFLI
jgi:hypothetical protein